MSRNEVKLMVTSGRKRIGKSNTTLKEIVYNYIVNKEGKKARRVVIFDTNDEYGSYEIDGKTMVHVKTIPISEVLRFSVHPVVEVRRVVPKKKNGLPMEDYEVEKLLIKCMTDFRGGLLYIEDLNVIWGDSLPKKLTSYICNNAHRDCDIIFSIQSLGRMLPKMWQNTNVVRFHYQNDPLDRQKLKDDYAIFSIAKTIVDDQYMSGNIRYYLYVDKDDSKIRGDVTREMALQSIREYLMMNNNTVKKYQSKIDVTGKMQNDYKTAFGLAVNELFKKYFDFKC